LVEELCADDAPMRMSALMRMKEVTISLAFLMPCTSIAACGWAMVV
jgi:hypothetical protein